MAIEIFTWSPRVNPQQTVNFRVRKAQFGDGYAQVSGDGINTRSQDWELSFVG
ncbi:phage tail protein, partial [Klebsiella pneumoniae]|nr:phage tail protein [Klebsiella pneumoniae]